MKNLGYYIAGALLIGGGYWAYNQLKDKKDLTKEQAITVIVSAGKHDGAAFLNTLETGYLKAWAKAVMAKDRLFSYAKSKFDVETGTAVKTA